MTITEASATPDEITTVRLNDEWETAGLNIETYRSVLARTDSDPEYRRALAIEWANELGDKPPASEEEEREQVESVRAWIDCRIQMITEVWPILKSAILAARRGQIVDVNPSLYADTGARFVCACKKVMAYARFDLSDHRDTEFFRNVEFGHVDDSECPILLEDGDTGILEYLGLGNLVSWGGGMDLSFLDDEEASVSEPKWLIEGMFARGDYWSLFGPSEVGKSLLALDWALQMARKGLRVLYLDMENPKHVLVARFKRMGVTREDFINLRLEQFPEIGDLALAAGAKQLHEKVDKHRADVIILDTISKFSQTGQATHSDRWQKMYNESFKPLLARGISIGQLDHTGLSDKTRERDSSAKRDNVSVAWALTWRGKDRLTLTRAKNRPNYQSAGSIAVDRVDEPLLTHRLGESAPEDIIKALAELDRLGVPEKAGRPAARAALDAAGISMADNVLNQAIRLRKAS